MARGGGSGSENYVGGRNSRVGEDWVWEVEEELLCVRVTEKLGLGGW